MKYLSLDPSVTAACLDPIELAAENQECYIFCPTFSKYLTVTTSSPMMKEQDSKYVEIHSDIRGHGKSFKLKSHGEGKYQIVTLNEDGNEDGFLYLSEKIQSGLLHRSANIMKSNEIIQGSEQLYEFEIVESDSQCGLYKMKCGDKTLFGNKGTNSYLLADSKDDECQEIWFQFNLKTRIEKRDETGEEKLFDVTVHDTHEESFDYKNANSENVHVKFDRKDKMFIAVDPKAEYDESACEQLMPIEPIEVDANGSLSLKFSAKLTTYMKQKKVKIETESGKQFTGYLQQRCFHNERGWRY